MNTMLSQLKQWPPTGSTVIGGGMMIGLVIYMVTGSIEGAVAIAGLFKMLCPQDAGATDQVLDALRRVTVRPVAVLLACAVLVGLAACQGGAQQTGVDLAQDAGAGIVRNLSAADLQKLRDTCLVAAPAVVAATAPGMPATLKDVSVYPYAFCQQLISGSAGNVDQTSLAWLPKILAMVQDAASVAGVVLPIVLKAIPAVAAVL